MDLFKYTECIKIEDSVLEHLLDTKEELSIYMRELSCLNEQALDIFLFDAMVKENISSSELENGLYTPSVINFCQDKLNDKKCKLTIEMIKEVNTCVLHDCDSEIEGGNFRDTIAWVGTVNGKPGIENARYIAPHPILVPGLMEQFVEYVNTKSELDPIIKTAIIHILFIKIHPFVDGNGRTGRLLHHHCLTQFINQEENTNFNWPILNLSKFLDLTRGNYYTCENDIIFDMETDNNQNWNNWFNYILNRIDDNLFYYRQSLKNSQERLEKIGSVKIYKK